MGTYAVLSTHKIARITLERVGDLATDLSDFGP